MSGQVVFTAGIGGMEGFAPRPGSWRDDSHVVAAQVERRRVLALLALLGTPDAKTARIIEAVRKGESAEAVAAEIGGGKKA